MTLPVTGLTSDSCIWPYKKEIIKKTHKKLKGKNKLTSKALTRSSLLWEAEIQMRALASNKGVAGNATVTTATCMNKVL